MSGRYLSEREDRVHVGAEGRRIAPPGDGVGAELHRDAALAGAELGGSAALLSAGPPA